MPPAVAAAAQVHHGPVGASGSVVYQPAFVRGLAVVTWSALAVSVVTVSLDDPAALVRWLPWLALLAVVVHVLFWRPAVVVDDDGVELRNLVRDVRVPWSVLEAVTTRFALTLFTPAGRFTAWAAPAPGRLAGTVARREARGLGVLGADLDHGVSASASPGTDSGGAALMVRLRWEQASGGQSSTASPAMDAAASEGAPPDVRVSWSVPVLVALVGCGAASAATLLV